MHESKTLPSWSKIIPVWNSIHLSMIFLFFCQPDVCSQAARISFLFSFTSHTLDPLPARRKHSTLFFLAVKYIASSKFLKANKSHGLCKSPSWRLSLVYQLWTRWAHHLSGRRSFWIRNKLRNREVRHTKGDVSEMSCQQDFPLNYFLCTGCW